MECAQTDDTMSGAYCRGHWSWSNGEGASTVAPPCGLRLSRRVKRGGPRPQRLLNLSLARSLREPLGGIWVGVGLLSAALSVTWIDAFNLACPVRDCSAID